MAKKILIVDDEPELVKATVIRFKAVGYDILSAPDGQEGVDMTKKHKPDLILLDIIMPKMDGYEVCKKLKADPETKEIPIIIFTASQQRELEKKCVEAGAEGIIMKPFETSELLEMANKFLKSE